MVKYESIYLNGYGDFDNLTLALTKYFSFYNLDRPHQSFGNQTPVRGYESTEGAGALILYKYPGSVIQRAEQQRVSAHQLRLKRNV